jgi:hypothetical protein
LARSCAVARASQRGVSARLARTSGAGVDACSIASSAAFFAANTRSPASIS